MSRRGECGRQTVVGDVLARQVAALSRGAVVGEVGRTPGCELERHARGGHRALVMELDRDSAGAVWVMWRSAPPTVAAVLPDCDAFADGGDPCCRLFTGHRGGHTWEFEDPP